MKKKLSIALLCLCTLFAEAQNVEEAQQVVDELYKNINYDGKNMPDFDGELSLYTKTAQLKWVSDSSVTEYTPEEFMEVLKQQIDDGIIIKATEYEITNEPQIFGNIAHFFSSYRTIVEVPQGTIDRKGVNSIQLVKDAGNWKIASIVWYDESPELPLPMLLSESKSEDRKAIERAGLNYIESIYDVDKTKLKSVSENLTKQGYYFSRKDSAWSISPMTYDELVQTAETYNKKKWIPEQAPKSVEILDMDERVANVKVYAIWGFDYLLMTKSDEGEWIIEQILWQSYNPQFMARMRKRNRK